jgi:hypothetical protein
MIADYINYFRSLAVAHKDLLHNPLSEGADGPAEGSHFTTVSVDEVLSALRSGIGFACLCLELYEVQTQSQQVADIKLLPKGAFMVIDNPVDTSFESITVARIKTEQIVYDFLKKIWQDHYGEGVDPCLAPFKFFDFDNITITPVGPIFSGQYGHRVVFDFELQQTLDITEAPAAGTFL